MKRVNDIVRALFRPLRKKFTLAQQWVIVLSMVAMVLGLINLMRAALALRYDVLLPNLPMTVPLVYLAVTGVGWGAAFIACAAGLARFHHWGRWGTLGATILYEIHVWINHLLFDASDYAFQTRPRDLAFTLFLLIFIWGSLNLADVRKVFK